MRAHNSDEAVVSASGGQHSTAPDAKVSHCRVHESNSAVVAVGVRLVVADDNMPFLSHTDLDPTALKS